MRLTLLVSLALVGLLVTAGPADASINLTVVPDYPVYGGDTCGITGTGGLDGDLGFLAVGAALGTSTFDNFTLDVAWPFATVYAGHFNSVGVLTGGWTFSGVGPVPGLAGSTLHLQLLVVGSGPTYGVSNLDQLQFGS